MNLDFGVAAPVTPPLSLMGETFSIFTVQKQPVLRGPF